jgi:hypothetical protein
VTHKRQKKAPAEPPRSRDTGDETGVGLGRGSASGTPRWVSVLGIVLAVGLVLLFLVLHLTGELGPGAH